MSNASKQKGTKAETAVVNYLRERGVDARRNPPAGKHDIGDIDAYDDQVIEVKDCKTMTLPAWLRELDAEKDNAGTPYGVVCHKRKGTTDVGEWYATMRFEDWCELVESHQALGRQVHQRLCVSPS